MTPQEARAPRSQRQAQPTVPDEDPEVLDALFAPPDEHAPGFAQSPGPQTMADLYRGLAEALPSPDLQALTEMTQRLGM